MNSNDKMTPKPLTEIKRSKGRDKHHRKNVAHDPASKGAVPRTCPECGKVFEAISSKFSFNDCLSSFRREVVGKQYSEVGPAKLGKLRDAGKDPAHGGEAARKRGRKNSQRARERAEREALYGGGADKRERFKKEILPGLKGIPLSRIVEATGLSLRYASLIRQGEYIPHPVQYDAFRRLLGTDQDNH